MNHSTRDLMNYMAAPVTPYMELRHPNVKGTGTALRMAYVRELGQKARTLTVAIAPQSCDGNFAWACGVSFALDFTDAAHVLQVFRGECESIHDGKGLFQQTLDATNVLRMNHDLSATFGYAVEISNQFTDTHDINRGRFILTPAESLGLCEAISGMMSKLASLEY